MLETAAVKREPSITDSLFAKNRQCVLDVIKSFTKPEYIDGLRRKNLAEQSFDATMELIYGPKEELVKRGYDQLSMAEAAMAQFIGESGDVLLPYSGGRDSTTMALLLSMMMLNEATRKFDLITVLNGFTDLQENPRTHFELIKKVTGNSNIRHLYFDLSGLFKANVVDSAGDDLARLGYPGFCSGCKLNMEAGIAMVAENLYPDTEQIHIPMGYNYFQGSQQWPEQTKPQMDTIHTAINGRNGRAHIGAPMYDVTQYAVDSSLMLALFGIGDGSQKREMKCVGAGTNPISIDEETLAGFVSFKYEQTLAAIGAISSGLIGLVTETPVLPTLDHRSSVLAFKADPENMKGVYTK